MDRRRFLGIAGGAIAGTALAACGSSPSTNPTPTTGSHSTTSSTPPTTNAPTTTTTAGPVTQSDWETLSRTLSSGAGLVQPGNSAYTAGSQLFDPTFDSIMPKAIAYCATSTDVANCIKFVQDHDLAFAARSGGHSYGGYSTSTGLVIDVTRQNTVQLDQAGQIATIGAGSFLVDIYSYLGQQGFALAGGSCPTVGIAGLTLGGGLGVVDRQFGLTCDNLTEATVVLASGSVVTCSTSENPDLFWALQGGGGGNFGIVTDFKFKVHPIGNLGLFTLVWDWDDAPNVIEAWQSWGPNNPSEIWSNCQLLNSQSTPNGVTPAARVTGVSVGSVSALQDAVSSFIASVGRSPFNNFVGGDTYANTMLIEAGCEGSTVAECHLPSQNVHGRLTRSPFAAKSDWLSTPLPSAGITALVDALNNRSSSGYAGGGIVLDSAGGAINQVAPDATAFVHRNSLCSLQYSAGWNTGDSQSVISANQAWLQSAWTGMRPYVNGQAYQNYIDPLLDDWAQAYYGTNLQRLTQIKRTYDPNNLFKFAQSIPLES
jgi:FAD binding domain/Berberine and berberine like